MTQDITEVLAEVQSGNQQATERLLPLVYDELRRLAKARIANERAGLTIQATELVHEAYLRLVGKDGQQRGWNGRGHFFAAAAEAMRRILIEDARRKKAERHGGGWQRLPLDDVREVSQLPPDDLLAVDEALQRLELCDRQKAEVVKLRFFGGFSIPETAELMGISNATVKRHWTFARAWLFADLRDSASDASDGSIRSK